MEYFNNFLLNYFNVGDSIPRYTLLALIILCIVGIIFRILLFISYQTNRSMVNINANPINRKDEIKKTKSSLLNKIVDDYVLIGEKGSASIDTGLIVEHYVSRIHIIGLNGDTLMDMLDKLEYGILFISLIFALIYDLPELFGLFGIVFFIVFKIIGLIFNTKLSRENLVYILVDYVNREIGQFYAGDTSTAINRLSVELVVGMNNMNNKISTTLDELVEKISKSNKDSMKDIADSVNLTMESLSKFTDYLDEPLSKWKEAIEITGGIQNSINTSFSNFEKGLNNFNKLSKDLVYSIDNYKEITSKQSNIMNEQLKGINDISNKLIKEINDIKGISDKLENSYKYIEENQEMLKSNLYKYEESIKELTINMSDASGSIIGHHIEKAYYDLNEDLKKNIMTINNSNREVINVLEDSVEKIISQNQIIYKNMENMKKDI